VTGSQEVPGGCGLPNRVGRGSQEAPNGPALGHPTGPAAKLPALPVQVLGLPARAM